MPAPAAALAAAALAAAALAAAALLVLPAPPAAGHAAGNPPQARLAAEGRTVTIEWTAMADDAAAVGVAIGLLEDEAVDAYLGWAPFEKIPSEEEVRALSASPALRAYLLENIEVRQDGDPCPGTAEPASDFIADGARLEFTCRRPVEQATVRITMLHDQDPAYRTFGIDGTVQTTVHSSTAPEHTWDFTGAAAVPPGQTPDRVTLAIITGLALAGLGMAAVLLLHRRKPAPPARAGGRAPAGRRA